MRPPPIDPTRSERDRLAEVAWAALLAAGDDDWDAEDLAVAAYRHADALLALREER